MKKIDEQIRQALREEDAELLNDSAAKLSLYQEGLDLFRGRSGWMGVMSVVFMLAIMAIAVYAAIEFFQAAGTRALLFWSGLFLTCIISGTAIKIWAWMEMSKNAVTRELKRLELQVALLASRIPDPADTASPKS